MLEERDLKSYTSTYLNPHNGQRVDSESGSNIRHELWRLPQREAVTLRPAPSILSPHKYGYLVPYVTHEGRDFILLFL